MYAIRRVWRHRIWTAISGRRDKDNVCAFGRKVIQDALVRGKYLRNDGWKEIAGFEDVFEVDAKRPRIEVEIYEEKGWTKNRKPLRG